MTETSAEIAPNEADPQADAPQHDPVETTTAERRSPANRYGVAVAVFVGFVLAAIAARTRTFFPQGDLALVEFKLRDLVAHPPLVGAYSRFQWSHPGPVMYYALWPVYKLLGSSSSAVMSATLVWHGAWSALGAALLGRRSNVAAVAFSAMAAILMIGVGAELLLYPWNPYLNISVFTTFVVAVWMAAEGDRPAIVIATVAGSVLVQNHVGLVLPVAAGIIAVSAGLLRGTLRRRSRNESSWPEAFEPLTKPVVLSGLAALGLWALPLLQQLRHQPGNIGLLIDFFRNSGPDSERRVGFGPAARILSQYLSVSTPWAGGHLTIGDLSGGVEPVSARQPSHWPIIAAFGVLALACAVAKRRWSLVRLLSIELSMLFVAWIAIASIAGTPYPYLLVWIDASSILFAATAVVTFSVIFAPSRLLGSWSRRPHAQLRATCAGALLAGMLVAGCVIAAPNPNGDRAELIGELSSQLNDEYSDAQPIWFAPSTNQEARTFVTGLMVQLERDGHSTSAHTDETLALGQHRTRPAADGAIELFVAEGSSIEDSAKDPRNRQVAIVDEFTPTERKTLAAMEATVEEAVSKPAQNDFDRFYQAAVIDKLLKFRKNRLRVAVFEYTA